MLMKVDQFGLYDDTRIEPLQNNTPEQLAKARRFVVRSISDESEQREILMALGIEPPDFVWDAPPGRRGTRQRVKLTLDGKPYPSETGENNGAIASSTV